MTTKEAQKRQILGLMMAGVAVTQKLVYERFGCTRLGARIYDLKNDGVKVLDDWEYELDRDGKVITKWKKYWIAA